MAVSTFVKCLSVIGAGFAFGVAASSLHAQAPGTSFKAGTSFKDCPDCPEMVVVPAGNFLMGAAGAAAPAYEKPQHRVTFAMPFAIGKYEVTQAEWTAMMMDNLSGYVAPRRPVDGPTWIEAQEFVRRLSMKTGKQYRLPSEAEWEYAARAGGTSDYLTSNDPAELNRYAWYSQNSAKATQLVGQKQANAFGLHDVVGNVYEWVQDCYIDHHNGAPTDGRAVAETAGCARVVKGGSYFSAPANLRLPDRGRFKADGGDVTLGLRVARTLP
jgi:formylglycine-generating enzyme required for sulfatase activity